MDYRPFSKYFETEETLSKQVEHLQTKVDKETHSLCSSNAIKILKDVPTFQKYFDKNHKLIVTINSTYVFEWYVLSLIGEMLVQGPRERLLIELIRTNALGSPLANVPSFEWGAQLLSLDLHGSLRDRVVLFDSLVNLFPVLEAWLPANFEKLLRERLEALGVKNVARVELGTTLRDATYWSNPVRSKDALSNNITSRDGNVQNREFFYLRKSIHPLFRVDCEESEDSPGTLLYDVTIPVQWYISAPKFVKFSYVHVLRVVFNTHSYVTKASDFKSFNIAGLSLPLYSLQGVLKTMSTPSIVKPHIVGALIPFTYMLECDRNLGWDSKLMKLSDATQTISSCMKSIQRIARIHLETTDDETKLYPIAIVPQEIEAVIFDYPYDRKSSKKWNSNLIYKFKNGNYATKTLSTRIHTWYLFNTTVQSLLQSRYIRKKGTVNLSFISPLTLEDDRF